MVYPELLLPRLPCRNIHALEGQQILAPGKTQRALASWVAARGNRHEFLGGRAEDVPSRRHGTEAAIDRAKGNRDLYRSSPSTRNISASIQVPFVINTVCSAKQGLIPIHTG